MVVSQPWHALERNDQDLVDVEVHDKQLFLEYVLMIATLRKKKKKNTSIITLIPLCYIILLTKQRKGEIN